MPVLRKVHDQQRSREVAGGQVAGVVLHERELWAVRIHAQRKWPHRAGYGKLDYELHMSVLWKKI